MEPQETIAKNDQPPPDEVEGIQKPNLSPSTSGGEGSWEVPFPKNLLKGPFSKWNNLLQIFPEQIAFCLADIMKRISQLIWALQRNYLLGKQDPDGYEGISPRGTYDRLLPSEWLFADELPDEFLRRVVMHEHQFFLLKKKAPNENNLSIVLFDAGPMQMGLPRIVHLALLILLKSRAETAKSNFSWGVLQEYEKDLRQDTGKAGISDMINSRSAQLVSETCISKWNEKLGLNGNYSELWIVSDSKLDFKFKKYSRLKISEKPAIGKKVLTLSAQCQGKIKNAEIEMPGQDILVQIIRNPFVKAINTNPVSKFALGPDGSTEFSECGKKIIASLENGGLVVCPLPNTPAEPPGRLKYFPVPESDRVIAVCVKRKRIMVLTQRSDSVVFHRFPDLSSGGASKGFVLNEKIELCDNPHKFFCFFYEDGRKRNLWILDSNKNLKHLEWVSEPKHFSITRTNVLALHKNGNSLAMLRDRNNGRQLAWHPSIWSENSLEISVPGSIDYYKTIFLYCSLKSTDNHKGVSVAIPLSSGEWYIWKEGGHLILNPDNTLEICGLVQVLPGLNNSSIGGSDYYLVAVSPDKQSFVLTCAKGTFSIRGKGGIKSVTVCKNQSLIAYRNSNNDLLVYSLFAGTHLMHLFHGGNYGKI